jgi:HK97 family phage major capsid protein
VREENAEFGYGWVTETASRAATTTAGLEKLRIPAHEVYAKPRATQTLLDDSGVNIEGWISERVTDRFARVEAAAFLNANGVGKPLGLLDTSNGITLVASGSAAALTADGLIDLAYDLPEMYASRATFLLKRSSIRAIRKFKETSTDNYLWQPGLGGGVPATILGHPYREAFDMPAADTNTLAVIFGDFSYYQIVDRQGIRVLRDPYSSKPYIEFYTTKRVGGQCILPDAFRIQKCATSV